MEKAEEGKKEVKETETHFLAARDTYGPSIGKNILGWESGYLCFSLTLVHGDTQEGKVAVMMI